MTNKIILSLILGIFLISFASAWFPSVTDASELKDNIKVSDSANVYPAVKVEDWFGWGGTKADLILTEHTSNCSNNCESIFNINTYQESKLIDSIRFLKQERDGSWEEDQIKSYELYIKDGEVSEEVNDYGMNCYSNNDFKEICEQTLVGSHKETTFSWRKYNLGEVLPAGDYIIKIKGDKRADIVYDWRITTQGKEIEEWSVWGYSNYDQNLSQYWNFNGDLNGNTNVLSITGVAANYSAAKLGSNSISTYGVTNYYINNATTQPVDWNGKTSGTYMFWYKGSYGAGQLLGTGKTSGNQGFYIKNDDTNRLQFWWRNNLNNYAFIVNSTIYNNNWHHIAITWDLSKVQQSQEVMYYIDGVIANQSYSTGLNSMSAVTESRPFYIGSDYDGAVEYNANISLSSISP